MFQIVPFHFSCLLSGIKDKKAVWLLNAIVARKWHSYTPDRDFENWLGTIVQPEDV